MPSVSQYTYVCVCVTPLDSLPRYWLTFYVSVRLPACLPSCQEYICRRSKVEEVEVYLELERNLRE